MTKRYEIDFGGRPISIEMGKMAKQANGSAVVRYGDTMVLVTACAAKEAVEGKDFLPLTVNYMEMTYAAGKIPGGFFKREGRPSEKEVLCSRLIDRPLRPLFPEGYFNTGHHHNRKKSHHKLANFFLFLGQGIGDKHHQSQLCHF